MFKKLLFSLMVLLVATVTTQAQTVNVTFQVEKTSVTPTTIPGNWDNWAWPGAALTDAGNGIYEYTMALAPNAAYEFLFLDSATNKDITDPSQPCTNGNSQYTNRLVNIGANDTTICFIWGECTTCGNTPTPDVDVTFQLQNFPAGSTPYVHGSWDWNFFPGYEMTDADGDGVYEAVVTLPGNAAFEYKFVEASATDTLHEVLDSTWACTNMNPQYTNRVGMTDTTDATMCSMWASCDSCYPASVSSLNTDIQNVQFNHEFIRINSSTINRFDAVEVYNITGSRVLFIQDAQANQNLDVNIPLNGVYLLRITQDGVSSTFKALL